MKKSNLFLNRVFKRIAFFRQGRSSSRKFNKYYMSSNGESRNNVAKSIDYILGRILIFFFVFVVALTKFQSITSSVLISIVLLSIFHILTLKRGRKQLQQQKVNKRRFVASQKVYKDIMNKSVEELQCYILEIFKKSELEDINEFTSNGNNFTCNAKYKNETISVSIFIYKADYLIELKVLREFLLNSQKNDVEKGIVITTSDFTKDCYELINQISENFNLLLVNKEKLLMMIESNDMFPTDEEIDESIEEEIDESIEEEIKVRGTQTEKYYCLLLKETKIKKYLILSIFLFFLSFFTPYIVYYMASSGFTLGLACLTLIIRIRNAKTRKKISLCEEKNILDTLIENNKEI